MKKPKKRKLKDNEYQCKICKEIFEGGWSDEEALEEFNRDYPNVPISDTDVICDYCYKEMNAYFEAFPDRKPPLP